MDHGIKKAPPDTALSYKELRSKLEVQVLPNDDRERQCFDIPVWFELGDPNVHYHAPEARSYETSGEMGGPDWHALFFYILDHCAGLQRISTCLCASGQPQPGK